MSKLPAGVMLSRSGFRAQLSKDRFTSSGVVLSVDGIAQSQVNPEDPTDLQFEYIRRIGHIVDLFRPEGDPVTAVHLGAGALSVPRYIAHTRPGSRSQVIEWEQELVELVRELLLEYSGALRRCAGDSELIARRAVRGSGPRRRRPLFRQ